MGVQAICHWARKWATILKNFVLNISCLQELCREVLNESLARSDYESEDTDSRLASSVYVVDFRSSQLSGVTDSAALYTQVIEMFNEAFNRRRVDVYKA
jgi:hypothetical protein